MRESGKLSITHLLLAALRKPAPATDDWCTLAAELQAARDPLGAWLARRLSGATTTTALAAQLLNVPAQKHAARYPTASDLPTYFDALELPVQVLYLLRETEALAVALKQIIASGDMLLASKIVAITQYVQFDELKPLHALLAGYFSAVLHAIEQGELTIVPAWDPNQGVGELPYKISNGWTITIFNRANLWHYVSSFTTPNGFEVELTLYVDDAQPLRAIAEYTPPANLIGRSYPFLN
jgi:hypothetical protein